jgi:hypothetical protein
MYIIQIFCQYVNCFIPYPNTLYALEDRNGYAMCSDMVLIGQDQQEQPLPLAMHRASTLTSEFSLFLLTILKHTHDPFC